MTIQALVFLLVSFLMLCLFGLWPLCWPHHGPAQSRAAAKLRPKLHRLLKPRCPHDCPACRLASTASSGGGPLPADVATLARSEKPTGSPPSGSTPKASLVRTHSARTPGSQTLTSTLWSEMADMARLSGSRHFVVRPATPPSLPDATPPCIV
jgi:hypothetical protein